MRKYIVSDPHIMGGAPVIKGTRIPIEVILHRLKEGNTLEAIHKMYAWVDMKTLAGAVDEAIQGSVLGSSHRTDKGSEIMCNAR
jgi:uncharacterized protein (DUF433 family)